MRDEGRQGSKRVSLLAAAGHAPRRGQARGKGSQGWCAGIPLRNDAKLRRRGRIGVGVGGGGKSLDQPRFEEKFPPRALGIAPQKARRSARHCGALYNAWLPRLPARRCRFPSSSLADTKPHRGKEPPKTVQRPQQTHRYPPQTLTRGKGGAHHRLCQPPAYLCAGPGPGSPVWEGAARCPALPRGHCEPPAFPPGSSRPR